MLTCPRIKNDYQGIKSMGDIFKSFEEPKDMKTRKLYDSSQEQGPETGSGRDGDK